MVSWCRRQYLLLCYVVLSLSCIVSCRVSCLIVSLCLLVCYLNVAFVLPWSCLCVWMPCLRMPCLRITLVLSCLRMPCLIPSCLIYMSLSCFCRCLCLCLCRCSAFASPLLWPFLYLCLYDDVRAFWRLVLQDSQDLDNKMRDKINRQNRERCSQRASQHIESARWKREREIEKSNHSHFSCLWSLLCLFRCKLLSKSIHFNVIMFSPPIYFAFVFSLYL